MKYELPDEATLAKYMHLLQAVLIAIRTCPDREASDLADAVHNLPDLLMRSSDLNEDWQADALRDIEAKHPRWKGHFTGILERGAPPGWQLKWTKPEK
jgi:hypothetical protein